MEIIEKTLNADRDVKLTAYLQTESKELPFIKSRPAVLILPGGGYEYCSYREAEPIALQYLAAGYQAFVLEYSIRPKAKWPDPLKDYEEAMQLIRAEADRLNLIKDKIAVIGFSAGGHLAAAAATIANNKPNACILGYPVIKGETVERYLANAPDLVEAVDKNTAPCFVFASRDDQVVGIENSIDFLRALVNYDIPFESHIYSFAPHGFSIAHKSVLWPDNEVNSRVESWVQDSIAWLKEIFGDFPDFKI